MQNQHNSKFSGYYCRQNACISSASPASIKRYDTSSTFHRGMRQNWEPPLRGKSDGRVDTIQIHPVDDISADPGNLAGQCDQWKRPQSKFPRTRQPESLELSVHIPHPTPPRPCCFLIDVDQLLVLIPEAAPANILQTHLQHSGMMIEGKKLEEMKRA